MIDNLRLLTLSENTVRGQGLLAEWGLSVLIETGKGNILLDSGAGVSTVYNADFMDVDLAKIDKMVLSHGHSDHTGGLVDFLRRRKKEIEIVANPAIFGSKWGRTPGHPDHFAGVPYRRELLESLGAKFTLTNDSVKLTPDIVTTGVVPMVTDFEAVEKNLYEKDDSGFRPDPLEDDQAVIIKTNFGLVIVLGCAHRGMINTIYHAQKLTGINEVNTVVGGCHLVRASKAQIDKTVAALKTLDIKRLGVSHCTGMPAAMAMAQTFGERFFFNNAGTITTIPQPK